MRVSSTSSRDRESDFIGLEVHAWVYRVIIRHWPPKYTHPYDDTHLWATVSDIRFERKMIDIAINDPVVGSLSGFQVQLCCMIVVCERP